jgi:hypothetical protein
MFICLMTIAEHVPRDKHNLMDFHSCNDVMQITYPPEFAFQWTGMYNGREPNAKYSIFHVARVIHRSPKRIQFGTEIYCFPGRDAV